MIPQAIYWSPVAGPSPMGGYRWEGIDQLDGYQFTVERNKLLIWLEREKSKASELAPARREARTKELEAEFDRRMADLYGEVKDLFGYEATAEGNPLSKK